MPLRSFRVLDAHGDIAAEYANLPGARIGARILDSEITTMARGPHHVAIEQGWRGTYGGRPAVVLGKTAGPGMYRLMFTDDDGGMVDGAAADFVLGIEMATQYALEWMSTASGVEQRDLYNSYTRHRPQWPKLHDDRGDIIEDWRYWVLQLRVAIEQGRPL